MANIDYSVNNEHIENYLNEYIKMVHPSFAVLVDGEWGSGKTWFINNFTNKNIGSNFLRILKVKAAEDAWNSKDPERVANSYTEDSEWRNRAEFFVGHAAIKDFLIRKWQKETQYKLMKELWCYTDNRISVRFEYEWFDNDNLSWMRTHGNEHWEFNSEGLMKRRDMSANDYKISEAERRL